MKKNINTVNGLGDADLKDTSPYLGVGDDTLSYSYLRNFRIKRKRYRHYSKRIIIKKRIVNSK